MGVTVGARARAGLELPFERLYGAVRLLMTSFLEHVDDDIKLGLAQRLL